MSSLSVAAIKHHNQSNSESKRVYSVLGLQWDRVLHGRETWQQECQVSLAGRTHRNHMSFMPRKQKEKSENKAKT